MVTTTRALVLRTIRHADHRLILKAFTQQYGLRSYVVRVARKGGVSEAALQALTRVELVADERSDRDLLVVRDLRVERPYVRIPFDPVRAAVALFVQEVLVKLLRGEAADPRLYGFLEEAVEQLDSRADLAHFPLQFLLQLSGELGFMPEPPLPGEDRFDLKEGHFTSGAPQHGQTLPPPPQRRPRQPAPTAPPPGPGAPPSRSHPSRPAGPPAPVLSPPHRWARGVALACGAAPGARLACGSPSVGTSGTPYSLCWP